MGIPVFAIAPYGLFLVFSLYLIIVVIFLTLLWNISCALTQMAAHLAEIVRELKKHSPPSGGEEK